MNIADIPTSNASRARVWFFGFHAPALRSTEGDLSPTQWLGHCEAWCFNGDGTYLFIDPQARGLLVRMTHRHDEVNDQLAARAAVCREILALPVADDPDFRVPCHGILSCASICGALVGIRAYAPWTLRRKLLANGAEIVHGQAKGRKRRRQEGAAAGAADRGS